MRNVMRDNKDLIVGLDIGTSKIAVLVAEPTPDGQFNIVGLGTAQSRGLKRGVVVSIEDTVAAVQRALEEAELMAGCKITQVYAGISGIHVRALNSHGMVPLRDREVTQADVDRVVETARAVNIPADQQVLHVLPQEFIIDGQDGVHEPLGMSGVRLEVKVHIVTGAVPAAQNILKCVRRCGLEVQDLILQPLAASMALLNEDEKDLGVVLVDIGGGTADVTIFARGAIQHTAVIPIAGETITQDIAMTLRTPTRDAEHLKIEHGIALRQLVDPRDMIEVPGIGDRGPSLLSKQLLSGVIEHRAEEILGLVQAELRRSGFEKVISSGVVLTGGTSQMRGIVDLASEVFNGWPVRIGVPDYQGALAERIGNPSFAATLGLVMYGLEHRDQAPPGLLKGASMKQVLERMKGWFTRTF